MDIQHFLKRVKFEFYLYSLVALLTSLLVAGILYSYHARLIEQQNSLRRVNQLLSQQLQSVVLISDFAQRISSIKDRNSLGALKSLMSKELTDLSEKNNTFNKAIEQMPNQKLKENLKGLVFNEEFGAKIEEFLYRYQSIEDMGNGGIKDFQYELSNISNLAYRELFRVISQTGDYLRQEESAYQSKIKNIGNYLIVFVVFIIFMFWGLLFHPIYRKLILQYEKKNQALLNAQIASRAKNDFLANINHEIRTPMMTILGYIELLSVKGLLGENERDDAFKTINENAGHLLKLIDEILDLSKLELGEFNVNLEKISPNKIFEDLKNIVSFKTEKKGIELDFNYRTPFPEMVLSDAKRIKQALFNVLNNAVKFTAEGKVSLDVYYDEESSVFTCVVKDTGQGINEKAKDEIFKIFSQENTYFNRNHSGTGLGLALTKKILKELGGDIKLDYSEKSKGSVFSLWFKVKKIGGHAIGSVGEEASHSASMLSGKRLLVVDDAVENSLIFQKYLSGAGSDVDVANNGMEALELVKTTDYDLILLDIQMPELDGYQVLKLLREENNYFKPVVALTAHAMEQQRRESLRVGFDGHISKPVSSKELVQSVLSFFR